MVSWRPARLRDEEDFSSEFAHNHGAMGEVTRVHRLGVMPRLRHRGKYGLRIKPGCFGIGLLKCGLRVNSTHVTYSLASFSDSSPMSASPIRANLRFRSVMLPSTVMSQRWGSIVKTSSFFPFRMAKVGFAASSSINRPEK